jgi:hypothetical protein
MFPELRSASDLDAAFRHVVDAHSRAGLEPPPEPHTPAPLAMGTAAEALHTAVELLEMARLVHLSPAFAMFSGVTAVALAAGVGYAEIAHAWEEHARRGMVVDHEQIMGALRYILGRIPDPDRAGVEVRFGTHVRDGANNAEAFERTHPEAFQRLRDEVRAHHQEGMRAGLLDRGGEAEVRLRCEQDVVFRMGFEEAKELRSHDPVTFEARRRAVESMHGALDAGRAARVRG